MFKGGLRGRTYIKKSVGMGKDGRVNYVYLALVFPAFWAG